MTTGQAQVQEKDSLAANYIVYENRYQEATGQDKGNIQCFEKWSLETVLQKCNELTDCVGFSYGRTDGPFSQFGCLKNNHDAGWNDNKDYDGYTKTYQVTYHKYREAAGGNIQCFDDWSLKTAIEQCDQDNNCVGFSFGRSDGPHSRHGCLKGNYDGGWNNDSKYDGYEKIK